MSRALWYVAPGQAELRDTVESPRGQGQVRLRMAASAISRGTERLVFEGRIAACDHERMRAPMQAGAFPFPVKYGYSAVARVEEGPPDLIGRCAFVLHPHQDVFDAPVEALTLVPPTVPPARAVLGAQMETALNALWDSGAGPGDRIVIVGGGAVGLLIGALAAGMPGVEATLIDVNPARGAVARTLGLAFTTTGAGVSDADVVFHCSASAAGLATALACAGFEAAVIEVSWYGDRVVAAPLGLDFHARRLRIVSSQVGAVAASHRARWSHARRLAKALDCLADDRLGALITERIAFADLPAALPRILAVDAPGIVTLIDY